MKANLIISTEYYANQPSVFILVNGQYYGCLIYPRGRNFPKDETYWFNATCSDSDRYFHTHSVEYTDEQFQLIEKLQNSINANELLLKPLPCWKKAPDYKIKRGKSYQNYLEFKAIEKEDYNIIENYNRPYDHAITAAKNELRKLLLSVLN